MNFTTIQDAIKAWAADQSGLTTLWMNEPAGWVSKDRIWLSITNIDNVGQDESRYEQDLDESDPEIDYIPTFMGQRSLICSVRVESRDQNSAHHASHYLELLRTSMGKPSVKAAFNTAGLAIAEVLATVVQDREIDGRWESMGVMDIQFNAVSNVTDTAEATGIMDKVDISSSVSAAGDVNLDEEIFGNV